MQISTCVYRCFKPRGWSSGSIASNNSPFVEAADQERRTRWEAFRNSDTILTFYSASGPVLLRSIWERTPQTWNLWAPRGQNRAGANFGRHRNFFWAIPFTEKGCFLAILKQQCFLCRVCCSRICGDSAKVETVWTEHRTSQEPPFTLPGSLHYDCVFFHLISKWTLFCIGVVSFWLSISDV